MVDYELEQCHTWRFVNIKNGEKIPIGKDWQQNPNTLNYIHSNNVGVILGVQSQGLCAIDFDGIEAIDHFNNTFPDIDITNIDTAMWTSGKDYRMQVAFTVPKMYWSVLKRKVVNKLEFRWTGTQSILPPSKLNDGREYIWIKKPSVVGVVELPEQILCYWLNLILLEYTKYDRVINKTYEVAIGAEEVNELLSRIKNKVGDLKGDYDVWRTIAWATCNAVGKNTAEMLMKYYWPYKTNKELSTLRAWRSDHIGPTLGTLIKLSGVSSDERKLLEVQAKLRRMK